jgi:hypothetical protein
MAICESQVQSLFADLDFVRDVDVALACIDGFAIFGYCAILRGMQLPCGLGCPSLQQPD